MNSLIQIAFSLGPHLARIWFWSETRVAQIDSKANQSPCEIYFPAFQEEGSTGSPLSFIYLFLIAFKIMPKRGGGEYIDAFLENVKNTTKRKRKKMLIVNSI